MTTRASEVVGLLVTIGDELLLGDIPNGNAHHIALELRSRGFRLGRMFTVGDREEEIVKVLQECVGKCDFLIVTGGLGSTDDDRTSSAASRVFERPLVPNDDYAVKLREYLAEHGLTWSNDMDKMVSLPQGAVKVGWDMAGFFLEHRKLPCYFLPGVPSEMKFLLGSFVIPDLEARFPHRSVYLKHVIRVQGLFEVEVSHLLKGLSFEDLNVEIGYLPQGRENWVTLLATAETEAAARDHIEKAAQAVISRLGSHRISGTNDESLERVVGERLRERGWRMAIAESCTGGLLSRRITAIAGASDYFDRAFITYSNEAKVELLGVPRELLATHGAVSEPVAWAMATGARDRSGADAALSVTGIAGPAGGSAEKPVGTVFIGCVTPQHGIVERYQFSGTREQIQECATQAALTLLWRLLSDDPNLHCD